MVQLNNYRVLLIIAIILPVGSVTTSTAGHDYPKQECSDEISIYGANITLTQELISDLINDACIQSTLRISSSIVVLPKGTSIRLPDAPLMDTFQTTSHCHAGPKSYVGRNGSPAIDLWLDAPHVELLGNIQGGAGAPGQSVHVVSDPCANQSLRVQGGAGGRGSLLKITQLDGNILSNVIGPGGDGGNAWVSVKEDPPKRERGENGTILLNQDGEHKRVEAGQIPADQHGMDVIAIGGNGAVGAPTSGSGGNAVAIAGHGPPMRMGEAGFIGYRGGEAMAYGGNGETGVLNGGAGGNATAIAGHGGAGNDVLVVSQPELDEVRSKQIPAGSGGLGGRALAFGGAGGEAPFPGSGGFALAQSGEGGEGGSTNVAGYRGGSGGNANSAQAVGGRGGSLLLLPGVTDTGLVGGSGGDAVVQVSPSGDGGAGPSAGQPGLFSDRFAFGIVGEGGGGLTPGKQGELILKLGGIGKEGDVIEAFQPNPMTNSTPPWSSTPYTPEQKTSLPIWPLVVAVALVVHSKRRKDRGKSS